MITLRVTISGRKIERKAKAGLKVTKKLARNCQDYEYTKIDVKAST